MSGEDVVQQRIRLMIGGAGVDLVLYVSNPTSDKSLTWYVWDQYHPSDPPVFFGSMEDAGLVADALNKRRKHVV